MRETKLLAREGSSEEEKSRLEQFEENLKNSIFSVFYLLLKNQETTFWKFIVLFIIEYLQLLSYAFDESMVSNWKQESVVKYFAQFLSTFRVVYWLRKLTWEIYVIIFYIIIFLIFIVLIDFLYVAISFKHKRFSFMQPIQILRIASILIQTVLYIPIIEFFFTISECGKSSTSGKMVHSVFGSTVICFNGIHILHAALSYLMALIFVGICLLSCLMHYENRFTKDPTSKVNAKIDLLQLLSKTIYCFVFVFFEGVSYGLFKSILLCIFSSIIFLSYITMKPYFNSTAQLIVEIFSGVFVWTNYILLLTQIIKNTKFNGALEIYFLGIPIVVILIYTKQEDRLRLLQTSEVQLQKGTQCQKKNFFYLNIIDTKESDRRSAIILKGYINHHAEVCPYEHCPIKQFKKMVAKERLQVDGDRRKKVIAGKSLLFQGDNSLLLAQAKTLYNNGIKKFPKYTPLRIDYANFLQSKMKDRKGALNELANAEKIKPGLDQQFLIYRQRKIIEDELTEGQEHGGVDFIAALNFENQFKQFKQLIDKSALLHFEFWNHLLDDSPDLVRLSQQGAKINQSIVAVEDHWKKLSKMSTNTPKALKLYASYVIEILNDKETGNEQMLKAKEAANLRVNFEYNNMNEDFSDLNNYAQDGTPCIYISGEQEKIGIVNQCNMSLCKVFGYNKKDDIINKDVEILMPKTYSFHHKEFLSISGQKTSDQISSRERQVFGRHYTGFIFPIWLQIKNLPSLLSGRQYVATFKVEKTGINKNVCHMLLGKNMEILDISSSCVQLLGISQDKMSKKIIQYDIQSLMPQLFAATKQLYMNKAGAQITYYFPKIVQNDQKKEDEQQNDEDSQDGNKNDDENENSQDDDYGTSTYKRKKQKTLKKDQEQDQDDENDDENQANNNYQFKAIGNIDKPSMFQCNLTEIMFDLIGQSGGYFIRLETVQDKNIVSSIQKHVAQQAFQFGYDPVNKKFLRELRDIENKDYHIDKNYITLKTLREQAIVGTPEEQEANLKFQNMSYMSYLNRQQRIALKGVDDLDSEDDELNNSQDSSDESDSKEAKKETTKKAEKAQAISINQTSLPTVLANQDIIKQYVAGEGFGKDFLKGEIEKLINVLKVKQSAAQGVHLFVRVEGPKRWEEQGTQVAGLFADRGAEVAKLADDEEESEGSKGEKDSNKDQDSLKTNIKSKKAFSMAINDKTMPPAIRRLSRTAQVIIAFLIAIAISEYALVYKQFTDTKINFTLIHKSYERTSEIQKVVYNTRTLLLLNYKILTNYSKYKTLDEYVAYLKSELTLSLNNIYTIQNDMNQQQIPVSPDHDLLLNNKTVNLYFKEDANSKKALQFSLTEANLQISSTIFTVSNLQFKDYNETNEDVFFLMYNTFNDFELALEQSSKFYVQELQDRASEKKEACMILLILSIGVLTLSLIVLIPVVYSVNQQKDKVLSLFCEIDNQCIRALSGRCERFMNNLNAEEGNDDIESNDEGDDGLAQDEDDSYSLISGSGKRIKKAKGKTKTDLKFFLKYLIALLFIQSYYLANYLLLLQSVKTTEVLTSELNYTCITEPYYWFQLNNQREMLYDPNKPIVNKDAFLQAKSGITTLSEQNILLQEMHLDHQNDLDKDYWQQFEDYMRKDLCGNQTYFDNTADCQAFISGTLTQGLHTTFIRYFETLRSQLNNYEDLLQKKNNTAIMNQFNNVSMHELYVVQYYVTSNIMRILVTSLATSIQEEFSFQIERRIATFIVFLIVILIAFFLVWIPFLNGLNFQIYKTKLMLMIIPLEVLMKIKNVGKVLQSQSLISSNTGANRAESKRASKA